MGRNVVQKGLALCALRVLKIFATDEQLLEVASATTSDWRSKQKASPCKKAAVHRIVRVRAATTPLTSLQTLDHYYIGAKRWQCCNKLISHPETVFHLDRRGHLVSSLS
jgi:hypothetical protein